MIRVIVREQGRTWLLSSIFSAHVAGEREHPALEYSNAFRQLTG